MSESHYVAEREKEIPASGGLNKKKIAFRTFFLLATLLGRTKAFNFAYDL